jgi:hypothetical protein
MTKQITIRLNEQKFRPLLDMLKTEGRDAARSDSELVGVCLFYIYYTSTIKYPAIGMTLQEHSMKAIKKSREEMILDIFAAYNDFVKTGELPTGK